MKTITSEVNMQFGSTLKRWRKQRRMSQAALGEAAEVSTRHLSFLENGRARPSRQMVLVLASALEIPLRERNALLADAGFAPAYSDRDLLDPELAQVRAALDFVLARSEPNPALAVDRSWRLRGMNRGAQRMSELLVDPHPELFAVADNAMHLLFHPRGIRRFVLNWPEVCWVTLDRLRQDGLRQPESAALYEELLRYPLPERPAEDRSPILIPVHLRRDGIELSFMTLLTTLGSAIDATAQELTVEVYFPLDRATEAWLAG